MKEFKSEARQNSSVTEKELAKIDANVQRLLTYIQGSDENDPAVKEVVRPAVAEAVTRQRELRAKVAALREERPTVSSPACYGGTRTR